MGWGHFITDTMRLLWFLISQDYAQNFSEYKLLYRPAPRFRLEGNYKRMLEIIGVDFSLLSPVTEIVQCNTIVLPDECFFKTQDGTRLFTSEYIALINHIRDFASAHTNTMSPRKFYFSYSKYKDNKTFGEDKLETFFASKGYEIVYPENLSLDAQLNILVNAESFASTIGSCSHNMLFLQDNTEVILIPRANYLTGYQLAVDHVHKLNIYYIDSSFSIFTNKSPWGGPFLYFISSNLRKFFHDDNTEHIINVRDFKNYLSMVTGKKFTRSFGIPLKTENVKAYKYYSTIAPEYLGYIFSNSWSCRIRRVLKRIKTTIRRLLSPKVSR